MKSFFNIENIRHWLRGAFIVLLLGVIVALQLLNVAPIANLRHAFFDFAQRVLPSPETSAPVTIVEIDETSIAAFGQWPWPRDRIAELVRMLARQAPAVIGVDLIFSEPDRLSPENVLAGYDLSPFVRDQLAALPTNDQALASSLRLVPTVLASAAAPAPRQGVGAPIVPRTPVDLTLDLVSLPRLKRYPNLLTNLPDLERASAGSGIASLEVDRDGAIRRLPTVVLAGDAITPSFAVEVARIFYGAPSIGVEIGGTGVSNLSVGAKSVATDSGGNFWLRHVPMTRLTRLSASEVLFDRVESNDVEGRIVLIGTTGTGLTRNLVTAGGAVLSALDLQALAVVNLLDDVYLRRTELSAFLEVVATLLGCIGIVLLKAHLRSYGGQAVVLVYAVLLVAMALFLFQTQKMLFDPSVTLVAMLIVYLLFIGGEIVATQKERRRTDEGRRDALILAESASHAKTNFLAGMSHELRTPLNAIIGFSEMIKDGVLGPVTPSSYENYAKDIHNSAVHLLDIVTKILDMANLESGETRLRSTEFDLKEVLDESIDTIRRARTDDDPNIIVSRHADMPEIRADRRMVSQMLLNLLLNAAKFSQPGEPIRIATEFARNGDYYLSVADAGSGMSREQIAAAFELFQPADQTVSDTSRGIGLGLPVTTAMIEVHGGSLSVASRKGLGTRMTLMFPAARIVRRGVSLG